MSEPTNGKELTTEEKKERLHLQVIQKTYELLTSAFALVAALAWNDAIQSLFKMIFGEAGSLFAKMLYAAFITVIVVYVSTRLASITKAIQQKNAKQATEKC